MEGSHDPELYPVTLKDNTILELLKREGESQMETQSGSNGTTGGGGSSFFSQDQFSREQLPPDQLS